MSFYWPDDNSMHLPFLFNQPFQQTDAIKHYRMQCLLQSWTPKAETASNSPSCLWKGFACFLSPFLKGCLFSHFNRTLCMNQSWKVHKLLSFAMCLGCGRCTDGWADTQILQKLYCLTAILWRESDNKWCSTWDSKQKLWLYFMSCSKCIFNSEILELYRLHGTWWLQQEMNCSLACCG